MHILLVRMSALGDIVHTWPLVEALRAARPDADITWLVEEPFRPLVEGHPAVDRCLTTATRRWRRGLLRTATWREIAALRRSLRRPAPDLCLDPQGVLKSALVSRLSAAPRRVGLARPWRREAACAFAYTEVLPGAPGPAHVVETNLRMVGALGAAPPGSPPSPDGAWLPGLDLEPQMPPGLDGPYGVLLPGAGGAHKVLDAAVLAEVARGIEARELAPVVAWGPGERARAEQVAELAGPGTVLAPPTGILELARLLAHAQLVVGADTGPVHLAAALGVRTVAAFVATSWRRNAPLGPRVEVVAGTEAGPAVPTGSACARPLRPVEAAPILAAADRLLGASV